MRHLVPQHANSVSLRPPGALARSPTSAHTRSNTISACILNMSNIQNGDTSGKKHLIVLCNGLWGRSKHWSSVVQALQEQLDRQQEHREYQIHASTANQLFDTYAGVDVCGNKLAEELKVVLKGTDDFGKISFIGHSMGGLIARNAVKKMFDKDTQSILGLEPCHFVTLATPHVGFVPSHSEDVPLSGWLKRFLPSKSKKVVDISVPFLTSYFLGEAGKQFFYRDGGDGKLPLLYDMSKEHWLDSLRAFKTRTCYGNMTGDHLVGWGNSSIRSEEELKSIQIHDAEMGRVKRLGVVREDPIECAWSYPVDDHMGSLSQSSATAKISIQDPQSFQTAAMNNLKTLGWRRIDVCFRDAPSWYLSHQHIMVQRPMINGIGMATARHLAEQISLMESLS